MAVAGDNLKIVQELLKVPGIEVDAPNNKNQKPTDVARESGNDFIIDALRIKDLHNSGRLLARMFERETLIQNADIEMQYMQTKRLDGLHKNVERDGQRNRSATLLIPGSAMDLYSDVGFLYDANQVTPMAFIKQGGVTYPGQGVERDKEFFNSGVIKDQILPITSIDEFISYSRENTTEDYHNEVLINFTDKALVGIISKSDSEENKCAALELKYYMQEKNHKPLEANILKNGNVEAWNPSPEVICELAYIAASMGHARVMKNILQYPVDIDAVQEDGMTLLHKASKEGYLEVVQELLNHGCDLNKADGDGITPLQAAITNGHIEVMHALIDKGGMDITTPNLDGSLLLQTAIENGFDKIAQDLIEKGADINARDEAGATPMHAAIKSGRAVVIKDLIARGADVNARDNYGKTGAESLIEMYRAQQLDSVGARNPFFQDRVEETKLKIKACEEAGIDMSTAHVDTPQTPQALKPMLIPENHAAAAVADDNHSQNPAGYNIEAMKAAIIEASIRGARVSDSIVSIPNSPDNHLKARGRTP